MALPLGPVRARGRVRSAPAALVLAAAVLLVGGCGEDPPAVVAPPQASGARTPGAGAPAAVDPRPATAPANGGVPQALIDAVLALPAVRLLEEQGVRLQQALGAPRLVRTTEAPDGQRRVRFEVDVERRAQPDDPARRSVAIVEVLVDAAGTPLSTRLLGENDPDLLSLFGE